MCMKIRCSFPSPDPLDFISFFSPLVLTALKEAFPNPAFFSREPKRSCHNPFIVLKRIKCKSETKGVIMMTNRTEKTSVRETIRTMRRMQKIWRQGKCMKAKRSVMNIRMSKVATMLELW